jgi:phosphodiesterase/alkaline phosphatase D-like protein
MAFNKIVQQGQTRARAEQDFTVKLVVGNLEAGQRYYYRFVCEGQTSETGRSRTLPTGKLDKLCIAVASCSNYPFGFFNAYREIALDEDIDYVLHLGDYIYEYGHDGYGGSTGKQIDRNHSPAHEIVSLADYRERHAQYKGEKWSRMMHAAHPMIVTWDDHESTNNPYKEGAQNHQPETEGDWQQRRNASLQAYYEWMPVRDPANVADRARLWRHFEFGDLASMITLETRHTGRDLQLDYAEHLPGIKTPAQREAFVEKVLNAPERSMLSDDMTAFFAEQMAKAKSKQWRLIGNQIPMARTHVPRTEHLLKKYELDKEPLSEETEQFLRLGEFDLPIFTDTWDGYPAAREAFYAMNRELGVEDLIVLTGDSHSFWENRLYDGKDRPMGIELGTAGITSPGDFEAFGPDLAADMDVAFAAHNREINWTDNLHRGFVKLSLQRDAAKAEFCVVDNILSEAYKPSILRTSHIVRDGKSLNYR